MRTVCLIGILAAVHAAAHYTWVTPVAAPLEPGATATVRIGHGHKFPHSQEAISTASIELFALAPSGARTRLQPAVSASEVRAAYPVKEAGLHRIVLVEDRGVSSRTPQGVKPGGRDRNPDAAQAFRTLRTAVAYAPTANAAPAVPKPVGLEFELVAEFAGGGWRLQLLKQGAPVSGAVLEVFLPGAPAAVEAGRTGPDGRLTHQPPPGAKGPVLFSAAVRDRAPAGAPYDTINYSTSLYVTW